MTNKFENFIDTDGTAYQVSDPEAVKTSGNQTISGNKTFSGITVLGETLRGVYLASYRYASSETPTTTYYWYKLLDGSIRYVHEIFEIYQWGDTNYAKGSKYILCIESHSGGGGTTSVTLDCVYRSNAGGNDVNIAFDDNGSVYLQTSSAWGNGRFLIDRVNGTTTVPYTNMGYAEFGKASGFTSSGMIKNIGTMRYIRSSKTVSINPYSVEKFANLLYTPTSELTTLITGKSTWAGGKEGTSKVVWSQLWKDSSYNSDTGDMTLWLQKNSDTVSTINLSLDGKVKANLGFVGPLNGNVTGNCSGSSASCTGNSASSSYPQGFSQRNTSATWGTHSLANAGTMLTDWHTSGGGDIKFLENSGQVNVIVDGHFVQDEGKYQVLDTSNVKSTYSATDTNPINGVGVASAIQNIAENMNASNKELSNLSASGQQVIDSRADGRIQTLIGATSSKPAKRYVIDTYVNGTSGYTIWSDGYCEQWGRVSMTDSTNTTVTFPKTFANTNYTFDIHGIRTSGSDTYAWQCGIYNTYSTSSMQIRNSSNGTMVICWKVSGYLASGQY